MRFWNFVLFVRPAWRTPRMISIDESRSRCCVPLRVLPRRQSRPDPVRPGAGIIFQPYTPSRNPAVESVKNVGLEKSIDVKICIPRRSSLISRGIRRCRCCIIAASPLSKKAAIFFLRYRTRNKLY